MDDYDQIVLPEYGNQPCGILLPRSALQWSMACRYAHAWNVRKARNSVPAACPAGSGTITLTIGTIYRQM